MTAFQMPSIIQVQYLYCGAFLYYQRSCLINKQCVDQFVVRFSSLSAGARDTMMSENVVRASVPLGESS